MNRSLKTYNAAPMGCGKVMAVNSIKDLTLTMLGNLHKKDVFGQF
jgi:hypothetical protein